MEALASALPVGLLCVSGLRSVKVDTGLNGPLV